MTSERDSFVTRYNDLFRTRVVETNKASPRKILFQQMNTAGSRMRCIVLNSRGNQLTDFVVDRHDLQRLIYDLNEILEGGQQ